jgi:hypothetical protein
MIRQRLDLGPDISEQWTDGGMSLRDWFAGKAIGQLDLQIYEKWEEQDVGPQIVKSRAIEVAKYAYEIADAMLEAREQA